MNSIITKNIEVVTRNAPAAGGPNHRLNVQKGITAVAQLFAFITEGSYPACLTEGSPADKIRGVVQFPLELIAEPPPGMLAVLKATSQRVFDQVANGQSEESVLAIATEEITKEFNAMPGLPSQES